MKTPEPKRSPYISSHLFLWIVLLATLTLLSGCGLFPQTEKKQMHRVPAHKLNTTIKAIERDIGRAHKYLKGTIVLALTIDPDGEIDDIKVTSNLLNEPQVEKDILQMFDTIIIENSSQDGLKINIPLIF